VAGLCACQGGSGGGSAPTTTQPRRGALLQSPPQLVQTLSTTQLLAALTGNDLGGILLTLPYTPVCSVSVYHLEYETVDPAGNLTSASGALMVPSGGANCQGARPLVLYAHGTATDRAYDIANLSAAENGEGLIMAAVFAAQGYVVIAPNYVGYDISTLDYHPFLNAEQQSNDMMDALAAGRSALPTAAAPATIDGGKLFVTGYSQGGFVALATQRALEKTGTSITAGGYMSGPYALSAFADAVFEGEVNASAVPNITLLIDSYQHAYGNIYAAASDVISSPYAGNIESLLPSSTPISTLEGEGKLPAALFSPAAPSSAYAAMTPARTPENLATVFAQGFGAPFLITNAYRLSYLQDAQASPDGGFPTLGNGLPPANPANSLRQALKHNDLRTFTPAAPVLLCAGNLDPTVFFMNTTLLENHWRNVAPNAMVAALDVDSPPAANDPYAAIKDGFAAAVAVVRATALSGGASDGGSAAVLQKYHAGLVPPFCLSAVKLFFDTH
jgi:hypothetical protein